jgi:hypothetical protein
LLCEAVSPYGAVRVHANPRQPVLVSPLTCYDRCWDDNTADTQASEHEDSPELAQVVHASDSDCSTASCHENRGDNHQCLVVATENRKKPEDDTSACQDRETDGKSTNTYTTIKQSASTIIDPGRSSGKVLHRVVTIYITIGQSALFYTL